MKFDKYKENLEVITTSNGVFVVSYLTLVAKIDYTDNTITELSYHSATTRKHINYVAKQLNLKLIKIK